MFKRKSKPSFVSRLSFFARPSFSLPLPRSYQYHVRLRSGMGYCPSGKGQPLSITRNACFRR